MRNTTAAELANTLAIAKVQSDIRWLEIVKAIPKYRNQLAVRYQWLHILTAREGQLGVGSRSIRRTESEEGRLIQ